MKEVKEIELTGKEKEIIDLVFRYRFLNRIQIQKLLGHTFHNRVNAWLLKLVKDKYLAREYKRTWGENRKPATYYLAKKGVRYLLKTKYKGNLRLKKLLHEERISLSTMQHSILAANFCLTLKDYAKSKGHDLEYYTEADLEQEQYKTILKPDAYFRYITPKGEADCFVEIDLETETRATFKRKMDRYITFYFSNAWKKNFTEFPTVGIICITTARMKNLIIDLEDELKGYKKSPMDIKFTTFEKIEKEGIGNIIWKTLFSNKLDKLL